jgi:hypothetical protein
MKPDYIGAESYILEILNQKLPNLPGSIPVEI